MNPSPSPTSPPLPAELGGINWASETLITLAQAAALFPGRPGVPTTHRWARDGLLRHGRRIKLESFRSGKVVYTSREAVARFLARQNATEPVPAGVRPTASAEQARVAELVGA